MKQTRALTEGAVLLAIYAVLLAISLYLPVIGPFFMFVLPIPFIVYVVRHSWKPGLFFGLLSLGITALIGTVLSLPMGLLFGLAGIVMGYLYQRESSAFAVLLGGTVAYIVGLVISYVSGILFFNINPVEELKVAIEDSMKLAEGILSGMGQDSADQLAAIERSLDVMQYLLPTAILIVGIVLAIFTQAAATALLKRLKYQPAAWPPFREWSFPKSLIWYYLLASVLTMTKLETGSIEYIAVINVYAALQFIIMVQGFAFIFYYFHFKGMSKGFPITIVVFSFLLPAIALYLVRILGIIDLGFDLRKRLGKPS